MLALAVGLAGALGSVARYLVDRGARARAGDRWPWGTLVVNVTGSLVLGLVAGAAAAGSVTRAVVGTGLCGGYTTWSAATWDAVQLARRGDRGAALAYAVGGTALCVAVAAAGLALGSAWWGQAWP